MTGSLFDAQTEETILHVNFPWLVTLLEWAASAIDLFAIALLLVGVARFAAGWVASEARKGVERTQKMNRERIGLARYILAALEVFIVSDIIHAALSLKFSDLVFLGLLVIIRSVISYFLDRELEQLKKELGQS